MLKTCSLFTIAVIHYFRCGVKTFNGFALARNHPFQCGEDNGFDEYLPFSIVILAGESPLFYVGKTLVLMLSLNHFIPNDVTIRV